MEESPQCHQETRQIQINDLNPVSDDEEKEKEEEIELPKQASISEALSVIDFNKIRSKDLPPLPGTEPTTPPTTGKKRKRDEVEKDDQEEEEEDLEYRLKRRELLDIMAAAKLNFPTEYEEIVGKRKVDKMKQKQLADLVTEVKHRIGATTQSILTDWAKDCILRGTENVLVQAGAEVKGLTSVCQADPNFQKVWNEMMLETMHYTYVKPQYRLALSVARTAYILHHQNKRYKQIGTHLDMPVPRSEEGSDGEDLDNYVDEEAEEAEGSEAEEADASENSEDEKN